MKACGYCGRQCDDQATNCSQCGTSFTTASPGTLADLLRWNAQSAAGIAITSSLAALLLASGLYIAIGRAYLDIFMLLIARPLVPGQPMYSFFIMLPPVLTPFLAGGIIILAFFVCTARCLKKWHGILAAVACLGVLGFLKFLPGLWCFLLPAVSLGLVTSSSFGVYLGVGLQFALGAWLLGYFSRPTSQTVPPNPIIESHKQTLA